jgi:hypothetical protein
MRAAPVSIRSAWALLFALLLSLRLIGSAGYMPAVDHGSLTIVACPDAELNAPMAMGMAHHHHGMAGHRHAICPYAAAAALGATANDFTPLLAAIVLFSAVLLLGRTSLLVERKGSRERPPAIGPPILH